MICCDHSGTTYDYKVCCVAGKSIRLTTLLVHGDFLYSALRPKHAEKKTKQKQRIDFTLLCRNRCKISHIYFFFIHYIRQFQTQLADSEAIASGASGSFTSFKRLSSCFV